MSDQCSVHVRGAVNASVVFVPPLPVPDLEKTIDCGAVLVVVVVGAELVAVVVGAELVVVGGCDVVVECLRGLPLFVATTMAMSTTAPATPIDTHLRFPLIGSRGVAPSGRTRDGRLGRRSCRRSGDRGRTAGNRKMLGLGKHLPGVGSSRDHHPYGLGGLSPVI